MTKQFKILVLGGFVVVTALLVWLFSSGGNDNPNQKYVSKNWKRKYQLNSPHPMGLGTFSKSLRIYLDPKSEITSVYHWSTLDSISNAKKINRTYAFVGESFGLFNHEVDAILERVKDGSRLFLSAENFSDNLEDRLLSFGNLHFVYADSVLVKTTKKEFKFKNIYQNYVIAKNWPGFKAFNTNHVEVLSKIGGVANFVKLKHGKGEICILSTPDVLFNFHLQTKDGFGYMREIFKQIPQDQDVIWMQLGSLSNDYEDHDTNQDEDDEYGLMKLIFTSPALLMAFVLTLLAIVLFVLFRGKRLRPEVPFLKPTKNMTLAFADTITSIYYGQRDPKSLLVIQKRNFYSMIQKHFFIDFKRGITDEKIYTLSEKTNLHFKDIKRILENIEFGASNNVDENYLVESLKKMHDFYRETGIVNDALLTKVANRRMELRREMISPLLAMLAGIVLLCVGTYYLTQSIGAGILLWPIGIGLVGIGILRFTKPYLVVEQEHFVFYNLMGRPKTYKKDDLTGIERTDQGVILHFRDEKKVLKSKEVSAFDRAQIDIIVENFNSLEL